MNESKQLVIWTVRTGIIFKTRDRTCVSALGVYDEHGYVWRLAAAGECFKLPVIYGNAPPGSTSIVPAKPLIKGKRYGVNAAASAANGAMEFIYADSISQKTSGMAGVLREPAGVGFVFSEKQRCEAEEKRPCKCAQKDCEYGWEPAP